MNLEISPSPSEDERAAIVAALAPEAEEPASAWADAVSPARDDVPEP